MTWNDDEHSDGLRWDDDPRADELGNLPADAITEYAILGLHGMTLPVGTPDVVIDTVTITVNALENGLVAWHTWTVEERRGFADVIVKGLREQCRRLDLPPADVIPPIAAEVDTLVAWLDDPNVRSAFVGQIERRRTR